MRFANSLLKNLVHILLLIIFKKKFYLA